MRARGRNGDARHDTTSRLAGDSSGRRAHRGPPMKAFPVPRVLRSKREAARVTPIRRDAPMRPGVRTRRR